MKTIYKYPISYRTIEIPKDAKFISLNTDCNGDLCAWAIVDTNNEMETKHFVTIGTGWALPEDIDEMIFLGTVKDNPYIWHVFIK